MTVAVDGTYTAGEISHDPLYGSLAVSVARHLPNTKPVAAIKAAAVLIADAVSAGCPVVVAYDQQAVVSGCLPTLAWMVARGWVTAVALTSEAAAHEIGLCSLGFSDHVDGYGISRQDVRERYNEAVGYATGAGHAAEGLGTRLAEWLSKRPPDQASRAPSVLKACLYSGRTAAVITTSGLYHAIKSAADSLSGHDLLALSRRCVRPEGLVWVNLGTNMTVNDSFPRMAAAKRMSMKLTGAMHAVNLYDGRAHLRPLGPGWRIGGIRGQDVTAACSLEMALPLLAGLIDHRNPGGPIPAPPGG